MFLFSPEKATALPPWVMEQNLHVFNFFLYYDLLSTIQIEKKMKLWMVWKKFDINKWAASTKSLTEFADLNCHFFVDENPRWTYFILHYAYYILYGNGWREVFLNSFVFILFF